jgi:hypothetical protein
VAGVPPPAAVEVAGQGQQVCVRRRVQLPGLSPPATSGLVSLAPLGSAQLLGRHACGRGSSGCRAWLMLSTATHTSRGQVGSVASVGHGATPLMYIECSCHLGPRLPRCTWPAQQWEDRGMLSRGVRHIGCRRRREAVCSRRAGWAHPSPHTHIHTVPPPVGAAWQLAVVCVPLAPAGWQVRWWGAAAAAGGGWSPAAAAACLPACRWGRQGGAYNPGICMCRWCAATCAGMYAPDARGGL